MGGNEVTPSITAVFLALSLIFVVRGGRWL